MLGLLAALLATVTASYTPASYACDGVTAAYTVNFPYLSQTDLVVTSIAAGGGTTSLALTTDYTLSASSTSTTATLTLLSPSTKCPSGSTLKIARVVAYTQPTSFRSQTNFQPATHEIAFDRLEMQIQQFSVAPPASYMTAKGDVFVGQSAGVGTVLNVGLNNTVLTADSTQALGVKWSLLTPGVSLQSATPGTQQIGHFNISGTGVLGAATIGSLTGYLKGSTGAVSAQAVPIPVTDGGTGATVNTSSTAYVALQNATPGVQQSGHFNVSGSGVVGTRIVVGPGGDLVSQTANYLGVFNTGGSAAGGLSVGGSGKVELGQSANLGGLAHVSVNGGANGSKVSWGGGGILDQLGTWSAGLTGNSAQWILRDEFFTPKIDVLRCDSANPVTCAFPSGAVTFAAQSQFSNGLNANGLQTSTIGPPTAGLLVTQVGGGTLPAGTYFYRVTSLNASGESLPSVETSGTLTSTGSMAFQWQCVPNASSYKVYGRTSGAEQYIASTTFCTGYTDNGSITPTGAMPTRDGTGDILLPANGGIRVASGSLYVGTLNVPGITIAGPTAAIAAGACATDVTVAYSGAASNSSFAWAFNAAPPATYNTLTATIYPTAGNANLHVCNPSAASVTPAAATFNVRLIQ